MEPRLKSSTKWTRLPSELLQQIQQILEENFSTPASQGQFFVNGRIYRQELLFSIGYLEKGRLKQMNFESSIEFDSQKQNALALIHTSFDACASMLGEYFSQESGKDSKSSSSQNQESLDFPLTWTAHTIENIPVYLRHNTLNTSLEAEADRLLGLNQMNPSTDDEDMLVNTEDDEDDLEELRSKIQMLGLGDLDDESEGN